MAHGSSLPSLDGGIDLMRSRTLIVLISVMALSGTWLKSSTSVVGVRSSFEMPFIDQSGDDVGNCPTNRRLEFVKKGGRITFVEHVFVTNDSIEHQRLSQAGNVIEVARGVHLIAVRPVASNSAASSGYYSVLRNDAPYTLGKISDRWISRRDRYAGCYRDQKSGAFSIVSNAQRGEKWPNILKCFFERRSHVPAWPLTQRLAESRDFRAVEQEIRAISYKGSIKQPELESRDDDEQPAEEKETIIRPIFLNGNRREDNLYGIAFIFACYTWGLFLIAFGSRRFFWLGCVLDLVATITGIVGIYPWAWALLLWTWARGA